MPSPPARGGEGPVGRALVPAMNYFAPLSLNFVLGEGDFYFSDHTGGDKPRPQTTSKNVSLLWERLPAAIQEGQ